MRAAQSHDEPTRMRRFDLGIPGGHVRRVELVDRDYAAGDLHVARGDDDDVSDLLEAVDGRAGQPNRRIAQLLQHGGRVQEDVSVSGRPTTTPMGPSASFAMFVFSTPVAAPVARHQRQHGLRCPCSGCPGLDQ